MEKKEKFSVGDLCLYYDTPVILLERIWRYGLGSSKEGYNSYLCLFYTGTDNVHESALSKL